MSRYFLKIKKGLEKNEVLCYNYFNEIRKEKNMNYEVATYLLNKISGIQEALIQRPPSLPANFGYIVSRIFLYGMIFFWDSVFFMRKKPKKLKQEFWEL